MNIAIITWNERSMALYKLLQSNASFDFSVVCIIENDYTLWGNTVNESNVEIVSPGHMFELYKDKKIDMMIVPSLSEGTNLYIADMVCSYGIPLEKLLYAPVDIFENDALSDKEKLQLLVPYEDHRELEAMEIHVTDHCNMKCKNCTMFAGLVDGEVFANYEKYRNGVKKLKEFFTHVKIFRVLGGEPLLNPQLYKYLYLIRETFPYTDIRLICNGTLVLQMPQNLIDAIRETSTTIYISHYLPISHKIDDINYFLNQNNLKHSICSPITRFNKVYNAKGDTDMNFSFESCQWRKHGCETMREGKIATCFVPFAIPYLNDHFNLNIKIDGTIDLFEEGLTYKEIRRRLITPFNVCRYCCLRGYSEKWDTFDSQTKEKIETWSI